MRVLLDECLPRPLVRLLPGHDVATVADVGWAGKTNGDLLSLTAREFDVFVTVDKNLSSQQNLERLSIGIVILESVTNRMRDLEPLVPELIQVLDAIQPGELVRLGG